MANILSQEEVDALLKGISGGQIETERAESRDSSDIVVYDLANQDRVVRGKMPALEMVNERFSRLFRTNLSALLRKVIGVGVISIDILKFGEFLKTLPLPTSLHLFRLDPLRGSAILVVEAKVIFVLVDILFGGTGREHYRVEGREFTAIETNLIKKVVLMALSDLQKAWQALTDIRIAYQRSEVNPQFAQIVAPTDAVVVINFEIETEFSSGVMSLCIPYATLDPIRDKLQGGILSERMEVDQEWSTRFHQTLMDSQVDLIVELGRTKIETKKVVELKKGDVIMLDKYCVDPLSVYVEELLKFKAHPGNCKGNKAVQISQLVKKGTVQQYGAE